ncbi:sensor histidine kinase [Flavobacterium sp.]|uniref:tetratricopeptide repeat-containing sensor histidine kinase n=1 Tax=Flavobacterium sp. TaxID=239 RepID=UPI0025BDD4A4|nr:sensor histidine kinase [Flavobacterium sp.]
MKYSNEAYLKYKRENNVPKLILVAKRQSLIYFKLGDSEKATEILYDALKLTERENDEKSQAIVLREMGDLLYRRVDYKTAMKRYHAGLKIARKIKNDSLEGDFMQGLFNVHADKLTDSTEYFLSRANAFKFALKTHAGNYSAYNNSFIYHYQKGDLKTAAKDADSMVAEAKKLNSKLGLTGALGNRAGVYYDQKDFASAKKLYDEMFLLQKDTISTEMGEFYYTYSGILYGLGRYKEAYDYAEKSIDLMGDTYGEEVNSSIRDVETLYLVEKETEKRQRDLQVFYIVGAVFALTLILLYFFYQNSKLKQKNKLIEIETETSQKLLSTTLDAREIERKEIAAVLHDNVSALLSSAGLQLTAFSAQQGDNEEIAKTRKILREAHDKVRDLSHELVPTLLVKFGLAYALEDLCEKFSTPELEFRFSHDASAKRYDEDLETRIYFITSELLNNAIKHSGATKAELSLKSEKELSIKVADNGKGFDTSKPDGFGLTQIRARVASMNGKVNVSSKIGSGTSIEITIPV